MNLMIFLQTYFLKKKQEIYEGNYSGADSSYYNCLEIV